MKAMMMKNVLGALMIGAAMTASAASAQDSTYTLTIKDNRFSPEVIEIKADQKVKLIVRNLDKSAEEFESAELRREKIIPAGGEAVIFIGPLKPGSYPFVGEFHAETAKGRIVVK